MEGGDTGLKTRLEPNVKSLVNYSERSGPNPTNDGKPGADFSVGE